MVAEVTSYFGKPRAAPAWRDMPTIDPVLGVCAWCDEPVALADDGVLDDDSVVWHAECWLLQLLRRMNADAGEPGEGVSRRDAARETVRLLDEQGVL
jgi:hypothetical protein